MNRAEPVEIEHDTVNNSQEIERIVRITRDDIALTTALTANRRDRDLRSGDTRRR